MPAPASIASLVIAGGDHAGKFVPLLGNGSAFGLKHLDHTFQERPAGIADALGLSSHFADGDDICVMLGDNVFEWSIQPAVDRFRAQGRGARALLAEVDHPEHYGVPLIEGSRIVRVDEKPAVPASRYA